MNKECTEKQGYVLAETAHGVAKLYMTEMVNLYWHYFLRPRIAAIILLRTAGN